jgi:hypothetical protein
MFEELADLGLGTWMPCTLAVVKFGQELQRLFSLNRPGTASAGVFLK